MYRIGITDFAVVGRGVRRILSFFLHLFCCFECGFFFLFLCL